ncbi:MAG TPA: hypothetical protein VFG20_11275 [Planctomycetaceae bacterium]|jgi:hypothetical protein|nr:hypothetical protein [Planctomycetaceae bacterium]
MFEFLSTCVWAATVLSLAFMFKESIRELLRRIATIKGYGWHAEWSTAAGDKRPELEKIEEDEGLLNPAPVERASKPIHIYWMSTDLGWARGVLLRGGAKTDVVRGLKMALHHMEACGLSTIPEHQLGKQILEQVEASSELTPDLRLRLADQIWELLSKIGRRPVLDRRS